MTSIATYLKAEQLVALSSGGTNMPAMAEADVASDARRREF